MTDTPPDTVTEDLPRQLRERVDELFVEYRGYEPSSFQESLSVVCDVADGRLAPPARDGAADDGRAQAPTDPSTLTPADDGERVPSTPHASRSVPSPGERIDTVEEVFPEDWNADPVVRERLPTVVDRYVENPAGLTGADREQDAVVAAAEREDVTPEEVRDSLVSTLYGGTGLPEGLAEEFFSEALDEAADVARNPPTGVRAASADGGAAARGTPIEDGFAAALLDDGTNVDEPTADCERCGTETRVNDLRTVIGPHDGSTVRLLCDDCAE